MFLYHIISLTLTFSRGGLFCWKHSVVIWYIYIYLQPRGSSVLCGLWSFCLETFVSHVLVTKCRWFIGSLTCSGAHVRGLFKCGKLDITVNPWQQFRFWDLLVFDMINLHYNKWHFVYTIYYGRYMFQSVWRYFHPLRGILL